MKAKTIPDRHDIQATDQWDLSPLFDTDDAWESLYQKIEKKLAEYERYKGRLAESVNTLKNAMEVHLAIFRDIEKLYTYAHLKSDQDKSNQHYLGLYQRAIGLHTEAAQQSSFMTPEIQSIGDSLMHTFLNDPQMSEFQFYLKKILRNKPHTLNEAEERILAMSREVTQAASQIFGQLNNADLAFGTITDAEGTEHELSHGNFSTFLTHADRTVRQTAFAQYYRAYRDHQNTIATTLAYAIKKDLFYTSLRKFEKCRQAALFTNDIADAVYDNLVETVRNNLTPLFDYLEFRKTALGLDELHHYDTYVPIVPDIDFNMPYEEAVAVACEALSPLGKEYIQILSKGLLGGWVDRYENRGKRSGAYSAGCYDSPPYILLNYDSHNINSLYTLIHEAGHSMHSYYSKTHQPFVDYDYTIFVAEVASTFNEALLSQHLLQVHQHNPRMQAYVLNREIDNIRATLYRQTMFAEFETAIHEIVEANQPLTLDIFKSEYRKLLDGYFGTTMVIDQDLELECLRIPHFYSAFYVYQYATGISAAIALADRVLSNDKPARDAYLKFLKLGGSQFPLDELQVAGINMRSPEPIKQAIVYFEERVAQLKAVFAKL